MQMKKGKAMLILSVMIILTLYLWVVSKCMDAGQKMMEFTYGLEVCLPAFVFFLAPKLYIV